MFVQPGIVYESGATLEEMVYASMISISGRISPPSGDFFPLFFMKKNAVQYAVCPNPLLTHRQAISHHHLSSTSPWFAQPASWEGVRGLLISHIIISFHSLWHRVRTEDRHGALWRLEAQSHGGVCTRVCACVRSLSFAENILVSIHFQLAKVHRRSSNDLFCDNSGSLEVFSRPIISHLETKVNSVVSNTIFWLMVSHCTRECQCWRNTTVKMSLSWQVWIDNENKCWDTTSCSRNGRKGFASNRSCSGQRLESASRTWATSVAFQVSRPSWTDYKVSGN